MANVWWNDLFSKCRPCRSVVSKAAVETKRTVKTRYLDNLVLQFIISRLSLFKRLKEKYLILFSIVNTVFLQDFFNPRGDHWAEFGPRDQCRLCARPKFGPTWYDVVEQFSFPSLVTDPGKKGVIGKLIHSSSCANFIQVQNAVSPNENMRYKTRGKVVPIFVKSAVSSIVSDECYREMDNENELAEAARDWGDPGR